MFVGVFFHNTGGIQFVIRNLIVGSSLGVILYWKKAFSVFSAVSLYYNTYSAAYY